MKPKKLTQKINSLFIRLDALGLKNEFMPSVFERVKNSVNQDKPIQLLIFTCSVINSEKLFGNKPWLYVKTAVQGNNLQPDLAPLKKLMLVINQAYPVELTVLIGNTDPYYIYLQQFKNFSKRVRPILWNKFSERWNRYKVLLQKNLREELKGFSVKVLSWYELEKNIEMEFGVSFEKEYGRTIKRLLQYFSKQELGRELSRLEKNFGPGKYFEKIPRPPRKLLKDWVRRKFAEYAVQGKWIHEYFPNTILIQNEKPSRLRSRMYQPLIKDKYRNILPIVYFLGIDDEGFQ